MCCLIKQKVKFLDKKLRNHYYAVLSVIGLFCSFALIVFEIPDKYKEWRGGVGLGLILFLIYVIMWMRANLQNKTTLSINNSTVIIKTGDIFEEEGLKVIAFNEYYDTQVDDIIIASNSLNGMYVKSIDDLCELDKRIPSAAGKLTGTIFRWGAVFAPRPSCKGCRYYRHPFRTSTLWPPF